MSTRAWIAASMSIGTLAAVPVGVAHAQDGFRCPPNNGQYIVITAGDIDCQTASDFAVQYDPAGDKYQVITPFTCYSGNAMTAPLLFQCVADTADRAEFSVYPA